MTVLTNFLSFSIFKLVILCYKGIVRYVLMLSQYSGIEWLFLDIMSYRIISSRLYTA
jgi:hypothetical protein